MSDLLSIGASGVRAYQLALNTVSENIANAGADGYTRRVTNISEVVAIPRAGAQNQLNGQGSVVTGINRIADDYRSAEVRSTGADLAKTETSVNWLQRIEDTMGSSQIGTSLAGFFNAATQLAADPTSPATRSTMLEAAQGVADSFTTTGASLDQIARDLNDTASGAAASLTTIAASLAKVNAGLGRAQQGTSGTAALLDQRDQLLEQMSALTDVSVSFDAAGRATVRGGNSTGPVLVDGPDSASISFARNSSGAIQYTVLNGVTQQTLSPNGGAMAGISEGAQRIADAQTQLAGIAQNFVTDVNTVQAGGRDLNGNPGAPIFALTTGSTTAAMTRALDDPNGIAAAAVGGGTRDNTNLQALAAIRTTGNYEGAVVDMTTANAATLAQRKSVASAQDTIHTNAVNTRDAQSGVNLDNEAVDMMRFQQAYSASSRVIQTARDTFQSILDIR